MFESIRKGLYLVLQYISKILKRLLGIAEKIIRYFVRNRKKLSAGTLISILTLLSTWYFFLFDKESSFGFKEKNDISSQANIPSGKIFVQKSEIFFTYDGVFSKQILDELHGFHKLADYFSVPHQLSNFLDRNFNHYKKVKSFIKVLQLDESNCNCSNALAIFSHAYWKLVETIYSNKDNYVNFDNGIRGIRIPLKKFEESVIKKLQVPNLYIPQITLINNFENTVKDVEYNKVGDPTSLLDYIKNGISMELENYLIFINADECANCLLREMPTDLKEETKLYEINDTIFDNIGTTLFQYQIVPKVLTREREVPELLFSVKKDNGSTASVQIPLPITMSFNLRNDIYVKNAVRAAIGRLLVTGFTPELIIVIKLIDDTDKVILEKYITQAMALLCDRNLGIKSLNPVELVDEDQLILIYRNMLIPRKNNCEWVRVVNNVGEKATKIFENYFTKNIETKKEYTITDIRQNILYIETKVPTSSNSE